MMGRRRFSSIPRSKLLTAVKPLLRRRLYAPGFPHEVDELREAFFGLRGLLRMPAFFGFEADPALILDPAKGADDVVERQVAGAEQARDVLAVHLHGIL